MEFREVSLGALIAQQSQQKVVVLLEVLEPALAGQYDYFHLIGKGLGESYKKIGLQEFGGHDYLLADLPLSQASERRADLLVDYFRQSKLKKVVRASWFRDGHLVEHSGAGVSVHDVLNDTVGAGNFRMIDLPVSHPDGVEV